MQAQGFPTGEDRGRAGSSGGTAGSGRDEP